MVDSWTMRVKSLSQEELENPSMMCRVYDRLAVQNYSGQTAFYCLELAAGNTLNFGFCRKENVPSLLRDVLTITNLSVLRGDYENIMIPTVPSAIWVKQARKYDPSRIVMWLENSITLTPEYTDCILRLRKMGMKFAVRVDAMGDIASNPDILACIDFLLVDFEREEEFAPIVGSIRQKHSDFKTIAFKHYQSIFTFTKEEAKKYDYVLGTVENYQLVYKTQRPRWQHEMLRTFAQLYSSIYDVKEIAQVMSVYPYMSQAMKGMVGSKQLVALTIKRNAATLAENPVLTQNDLRNFLAISVAYHPYIISEEHSLTQRRLEFDIKKVNFEPFIQALFVGKLVEQIAQGICDDIQSPQSFLAGMFRYAQTFLHDTAEKTFDEFPLNAVSSNYKDGGGQLGAIIKVIILLVEHHVEEALEEKSVQLLNSNKDQFYNMISHAMNWADAVAKALGIVKDVKERRERRL